MTFDYEIALFDVTYGKNTMGDPIETKTKRTVLASILDYRNKDFYQAMANGLKPEITFGINKYEYNNEKKLEFQEKEYRIVDIYPIKSKDESEFETMALICEGLVNNNATT